MSKSIFHVRALGNLANQMIQYMVAQAVALQVPGCVISNVTLREWDIQKPDLPLEGSGLLIEDEQHFNIDAVSSILNRGDVDYVQYLGYGQRMENFPPVGFCRDLFEAKTDPADHFDQDQLVINIRGGEILDGRHPGYTLVPLDFYSHVIEKSSLRPVFMGQIEENVYCHSLKKAFPQAEFRTSRGAIRDFQSLRSATNLNPSVSTFSWLAAWLSNARRIYLPLTGIFSPFLEHKIDLVPVLDDRYELYLMPANYGCNVLHVEEYHRSMKGLHRLVTPRMLEAMRMAGPLFKSDKFELAEVFDKDFYLQRYPDVKSAVEGGYIPGALWHYLKAGFSEGREPFFINKAKYVSDNPAAAFEIGSGQFANIFDHYVKIGRLRNYSRF